MIPQLFTRKYILGTTTLLSAGLFVQLSKPSESGKEKLHLQLVSDKKSKPVDGVECLLVI
jgi:hypothetical protein